LKTSKRTIVLTAALFALMGALPVSAQETGGNAAPAAPGGNQPTELLEPYEYHSNEGEFNVTWPSGCGRLKRRSNVPDPDADPFEVVYLHNVSCDQGGENGHGCSVTAIFNSKGADGGIPGPPEVLAQVTSRLETFGVKVIRQGPLKRELADGSLVGGVEVQAADPQGTGQVWMRGLLHAGDIFILTAWKLEGGLWDDPEFQNFFNSFEPTVQ